eukprot:TRINITY_DN56475_c0_g1_i2.p2 TRINITY_DN56475_c0_g1~~TRINITY_DN56475_c0_g1_i2.p2  ORF type:complete len:121 (+),score=11.35 TRINITY_DN56475_c0_g1_i2:233-595(+)
MVTAYTEVSNKASQYGDDGATPEEPTGPPASSCCSCACWWCCIKFLPFMICFVLTLPFGILGLVAAALLSPARCADPSAMCFKFQTWWWHMGCAPCNVWKCFYGRSAASEAEKTKLVPRA